MFTPAWSAGMGTMEQRASMLRRKSGKRLFHLPRTGNVSGHLLPGPGFPVSVSGFPYIVCVCVCMYVYDHPHVGTQDSADVLAARLVSRMYCTLT